MRDRKFKTRRRNGCDGKKQFSDYEKAKLVCYSMMNRYSLQRAAVYVCNHCGFYHLTKTPGPDYVALLERETLGRDE